MHAGETKMADEHPLDTSWGDSRTFASMADVVPPIVADVPRGSHDAPASGTLRAVPANRDSRRRVTAASTTPRARPEELVPLEVQLRRIEGRTTLGKWAIVCGSLFLLMPALLMIGVHLATIVSMEQRHKAEMKQLQQTLELEQACATTWEWRHKAMAEERIVRELEQDRENTQIASTTK